MRAGDGWLEKLAMFTSRRSLIRCPPSSLTSTGSQIATWRRSLTWTRHEFSYDLRPPSTGKMFVWPPAFLTEPGSARFSFAPSITTVWSNYQTSYNYFFEVYKSNTVTLSPFWKLCYRQFNFLNVNHVTNYSSFSLVNRLQLIYTVKVGHKYVNVYRHQLLIFSEFNNGESMTVTVLQCKASMQQIGLLLVPAVKGAVYINTHSI